MEKAVQVVSEHKVLTKTSTPSQVTLEHKHLAETKTFRWALLAPLGAGLVLGGLVGFNTELGELCFSSSCVYNFFEIFKFPIAIMGLTIPLVAMSAAVHRSIEASKQIEVASRQYGEAIANNRFGNYLKHRESFEKLVDGYCSRRHLKADCKLYVLTGSLYGGLFPDASLNNIDWNGQCDEKFLLEMELCADFLMGEFNKVKEDFDCKFFLCSLSVLARALSVNYTSSVKLYIKMGDDEPDESLLVPDLNDDAGAVFSIVRDVLGVLALVRSFAGGAAKEYPISRKSNHLTDLLKHSSEKFEIIRAK